MRLPNFEVMLYKSPSSQGDTILALTFAKEDITPLPLSSLWQQDETPKDFKLSWNQQGLVLDLPDTLSDGSQSLLFPFYTPSSSLSEKLSSNANNEEALLSFQALNQQQQHENVENLISASTMKSLIKDHRGIMIVPFDNDGSPLAQLFFKL